ncbi:NAD(P)/FAD-dependent oxidoreductase [Ramlibacter sp. G-1-2-2]|uniref:NAD(P)/FAD-dependent oxidoreductase n=1 Tax=Ramlibacter agri TaxID=2728837 RepID=A0A848HK52_9BURK|nr:NAD(P)/FAD-dependent oxidoreductase [Ramlibacter agri]NML48118.1 NAD(P)/FAD-dependent oxidoreductase [Ramlibacter agri]
MTWDLVVVGASFAGLACARSAALAGLSVLVLEKKTSSGARLHTTGLIVKDAIDEVAWLRELPSHLVRRIDGVRMYAPNLRHLDLHAPGYYFWATDTTGLLDWMVGSVRAAGAEVRLETLFTEARWHEAERQWTIPLAGGEELRARYLVGADGPFSRVAKSLGLSQNREFLFGVEHEYSDAEMERNFLHCFLDRELAPGYIGWAVSSVGTAQIGLARRVQPGSGHGRLRLDALLAKTAGVVRPVGEPRSVRAGMIPCGGLLPRVAQPGALLVGDAAGLVSPATAGGIKTALLHGQQAGEAVAAFRAGRAADPAEWLPAKFPSFRTKRLVRRLFEILQNDWAFNVLLGTAPMRKLAEEVYFHRKAHAELGAKP